MSADKGQAQILGRGRGYGRSKAFREHQERASRPSFEDRVIALLTEIRDAVRPAQFEVTHTCKDGAE